MGIREIILIVGLSIFVLGVVIKYIIDKKQGKCRCDCCNGNCACCSKYKKEANEH